MFRTTLLQSPSRRVRTVETVSPKKQSRKLRSLDLETPGRFF